MSSRVPVAEGALARLWFREVPGYSFAVLRIAFGFLGLANVLGTVPVPMYWNLNNGLVPLADAQGGLKAMVFDAGLGLVVGWAVFLLCAASYVCMMLGVRANAAVAASFTAAVFQTYWNPLPLSSAHHVLVVVLFALVWADCGTHFTLDSKPRSVAAACQPIFPLLLVRYQVALIYANSGLWKLFGGPWRDGSAIHYTLENNVFQRLPWSIPAWIEPAAAAATYLTLFWELLFPIAVLWRRTRVVALLIGVLLHVGVWATLEVGPFSWMMIASYVAFLDPEHVERIVARVRGIRGVDPPATVRAPG